MANKYTAMKIDIKKAIELYESGLTQEEVGRELGTTQKVIYQRFKKIGYKSRIPVKRNQLGENNDFWKGNEAGYAALHYRVEKIRGKPNKCEDCGTTKAKRFEWANLSGNYSNVNDYRRLCKKCHYKLDIDSYKRNKKGDFLPKGGDAVAD